jgi:hypothetical protein
MPQRRLRMASPYAFPQQQGGFVQQQVQQVQLDAGQQQSQQSYNAPILVRKLE